MHASCRILIAGRFTLVAATVYLFVIGSVAAQPREDVSDVSKWPTERLILKDGRFYKGLVRHEANDIVEFVEVGRRGGLPMYLTVRWIPNEDVGEIKRLPADQRLVLQRNIRQFRDRMRITAHLKWQIKLEDRVAGEHRYRFYKGPWFSLVSTTEESLTRESIVRLEQMFAGFRSYIPPRLKPRHTLRVVLLNTLDEYLDYQRRANLSIKNSAYFDSRNNEIVAGGQLATFVAQLRATDRHHRKLLDDQNALRSRMREKLAELTKELEAAGTDYRNIENLRVAAREQFESRIRAQKQAIRAAKRENDDLYRQQFRFLYHEAFHAYLDNYVYDKSRHDVPRWLHEGWAQVFESGVLDGTVLRLDVPHPSALVALQKDLLGGDRLPLAEVIAAEPQQFLVRHDDAARLSNRNYLYSWGLAHYLTFRMKLLERAALDDYLAADNAFTDPVRRFEQLVGMSLDQFQQQWRSEMLEL